MKLPPRLPLVPQMASRTATSTTGTNCSTNNTKPSSANSHSPAKTTATANARRHKLTGASLETDPDAVAGSLQSILFHVQDEDDHEEDQWRFSFASICLKDDLKQTADEDLGAPAEARMTTPSTQLALTRGSSHRRSILCHIQEDEEADLSWFEGCSNNLKMPLARPKKPHQDHDLEDSATTVQAPSCSFKSIPNTLTLTKTTGDVSGVTEDPSIGIPMEIAIHSRRKKRPSLVEDGVDDIVSKSLRTLQIEEAHVDSIQVELCGMNAKTRQPAVSFSVPLADTTLKKKRKTWKHIFSRLGIRKILVLLQPNKIRSTLSQQTKLEEHTSVTMLEDSIMSLDHVHASTCTANSNNPHNEASRIIYDC